jgi:hypothetical protein
VPAGAGRRAKAEPGAAAPTPSELAVKVDDWISQAFVLVTLGVFALILLNALLLGNRGFFDPAPTPVPVPTASPTAAPTATPIPTPTAPLATSAPIPVPIP